MDSSWTPLPIFSVALRGEQGQRWGNQLAPVTARQPVPSREGGNPFLPLFLHSAAILSALMYLGSGKRKVSKASVVSQGHAHLRGFSVLLESNDSVRAWGHAVATWALTHLAS